MPVAFEQNRKTTRYFILASDQGPAIAVSSVHLMLEDPWFTSLWTLQESYLCTGKSVFLSSEGTPVLNLAQTDIIGMFDLVAAGYGVAHLLDAHEHLLNYGEEGDEAAQLISRAHHGVTQLGFRDCFEFQEMGAYFAARHRTTTLVEDRVYGIMQIFNVKVGIANDPFGAVQVRSLEQLEDELGAALNAPRTRSWHSCMSFYTRKMLESMARSVCCCQGLRGND